MNKISYSTNRSIISILVVFACLVLTACGGSSGGGDDDDDDDGGSSPLATGGFTKTYSPEVDLTTWTSPFSTVSRHYLIMYQASDINGSGNIDAISFRVSAAVATLATCDNVTIRMGHSSLAQITNTTFVNQIENGAGSMQTVVDNATITIPVTAPDEYFSIPLSSSFNYNGVDNLLLEITRVPGCSVTISFRTENAIGTNNIIWNSDVASATGLSLNDDLFHAKFVFAGGDNSVLYGSVSGDACPLRSISTTCQHTQILHLASEINGSGPITGIAMRYNPAAATPTLAETYTVNIKLGHTTLSALTDTFANNFDSGSPVTVASTLSFTIPAGVPQGEYIWIPISDVFTYNGTDNLIVDIEVPVASGETTWAYTSVAGRRLYAAAGAPTGTVGGIVHETKFRFNGGTMDVLTDLAGSTGNIFAPVGMYGRQSMFKASELGTAGTITAISCRLQSAGPTVATDYPNYTVIMGHTDLTELNTIFANNYDDATMVHSGLFSLTAGHIQGDRLVIPITPFAYDGIRNLVVYVYSDGATQYVCEMSGTDAVRYPNQTMATGDYNNPSAIPSSAKLDMAFTITK